MALTASSVTGVIGTESNEESNPDSLFDGTKTNIGSTAAQITITDTPISKGVLIKVTDFGGGTYIKFGNSSTQNMILDVINTFIFVDWIDNLNKIYVKTDGTNAKIVWSGG